MSRIIIFASLIAVFQSPAAHNKSLITGPIESGFYLAPEIKNCLVLSQSEQFLGIRGGWIINHKVVLGGAWYTMISEREIVYLPRLGDFVIVGVKSNYGGLLLEYEVDPVNTVHVTFDMLIGAGSISLKNLPFRNYYENDYYFVAEPGANFTLNLAKNIRIGMGCGYRMAYDVEFYYYNNEDLNGLTFRFFLKLGIF